jgi:ribosomal protein S27AE
MIQCPNCDEDAQVIAGGKGSDRTVCRNCGYDDRDN